MRLLPVPISDRQATGDITNIIAWQVVVLHHLWRGVKKNYRTDHIGVGYCGETQRKYPLQYLERLHLVNSKHDKTALNKPHISERKNKVNQT